MPRFPDLSDAAQTLSARVYSTLGERARRARSQVYALHVGDTYRDPVLEARAEALRTADHPHLHCYAPVLGEPALIDAFVEYVQRRHDTKLDPACMQVMPGATAGLSIVCEVLLEPGDEVLLPSPFWPLSRGIFATKGAKPVEVPLFTRLDEPDFDVEAVLEAAVTERTAALYINSPNNPTGRILSEETVDAMLRVAERHELWVLCDEAYEEVYFGSRVPRAVWKHPRAAGRTLVCHTLSKSFGYAGARVGVTHGPAEVMRSIQSMQTYQTYGAPKPMQIGGARALRHGATWMEESRALYRDAAERTAAALGVPAPEAGTFLFANVSHLLRPDDEDCTPLLERCADRGVLLTPGQSCGRDFARWVRLCFTAVPPTALERALEELRPLFRSPS